MFLSGVHMRVCPKPPYPPPNIIPQYSRFLKNTGPEYIRQYIGCIVYVWMVHGNSFWIYPVDVMEDVLFCYAWDDSDWKYIRLNINQLDSLY